MSAYSRLEKEFVSLQKEKIPNAFTLPDQSDWLTWHFVLYDLAYPYKGGVYYGILKFSQSYPSTAPSMKFLTPNGRFQSDQNICTTNSNYHPESWTPAWNVRTILIGLVSHMLGSDGGIGTINSNNATKEIYAHESMKWNLNNDKFLEVFGNCIQEFAPEEQPVVFKPNLKTRVVNFLNRHSGTILLTSMSFAFVFLISKSR